MKIKLNKQQSKILDRVTAEAEYGNALKLTSHRDVAAAEELVRMGELTRVASRHYELALQIKGIQWQTINDVGCLGQCSKGFYSIDLRDRGPWRYQLSFENRILALGQNRAELKRKAAKHLRSIG